MKSRSPVGTHHRPSMLTLGESNASKIARIGVSGRGWLARTWLTIASNATGVVHRRPHTLDLRRERSELAARPETCAIDASDSAPEGGCPAFCVRCTCACCVSSVVYAPAAALTIELLPPVAVECDRLDRLPTGTSLEILHVPKPLLT